MESVIDESLNDTIHRSIRRSATFSPPFFEHLLLFLLGLLGFSPEGAVMLPSPDFYQDTTPISREFDCHIEYPLDSKSTPSTVATCSCYPFHPELSRLQRERSRSTGARNIDDSLTLQREQPFPTILVDFAHGIVRERGSVTDYM